MNIYRSGYCAWRKRKNDEEKKEKTYADEIKKTLMKVTELMNLIVRAENFENRVLQLPINAPGDYGVDWTEVHTLSDKIAFTDRQLQGSRR